MKYLIGIIFLAMTMSSQTIFNFSNSSELKNWRVVDDVVMGGRSSGNMKLSSEGHGLFSGEISLENNGGFSSVRYSFTPIEVNPSDFIKLRLKGDGKDYQLRVKHNDNSRHSYQHEFSTSGEWQTINVPLNEMSPIFHGRTLDMANFNHGRIEEVGILIGNNRAESFKLLIDEIELIQD